MVCKPWVMASGVRAILGSAILGVLAAAATGAGAVQDPPKIGDPSLRDPRVPASVPNISGVWWTKGYDRRIKPVDGDTPWQPATKQEFDRRGAAEQSGSPLFDPTAACMPSGIPRILAAPYPIEIIQTPGQTVILHEVQHLFRVVRMDGQHPKAVAPSSFGDEVGHWEGDALVIDIVGLTDRTQIDEAGTSHTAALHVVERIKRVGDALQDDFTIDDPKAFTKPWTARRTYLWRPDIRFQEYVCEENNRNAPINGVLKHF
jgi:hypothetical protein